jgi:hypothetical protein
MLETVTGDCAATVFTAGTIAAAAVAVVDGTATDRVVGVATSAVGVATDLTDSVCAVTSVVASV